MQSKLDPLRALQRTGCERRRRAHRQEQQLAVLLKKQAELANDITPEGEAKYMAVVAELTKLSSEQQTGA